MSWALVALYLASSLLVWQFVGYPLVMGLVGMGRKPVPRDPAYLPFFSVVVPAYNEAKGLGRRLENLLALDYPREHYEIIVVDSASSDGTEAQVKGFIQQRGDALPAVRFIQEGARRGKASAVGLARREARGDIILVTDANCAFEPGVLREIAPHFSNPRVGGVGGRYAISNPGLPLTDSTAFYWDLEYLMRQGEARLDSACLFHGELNAWRKEVVEPDPRAVGDDLDQAIQIRKKGLKIEYEPAAVVYEAAASTPQDQILQRKRTAVGTLQVALKHWSYLLLPRDLYSGFIFPSHKTLTLLSPFLLLAIPILYVLLREPAAVALHLGVTLTAFALLLVVLLRVRRRAIRGRRVGPGMSPFSVGRVLAYVLLNEYLVLLAWWDFLTRRYTVLWKQVRSTRG